MADNKPPELEGLDLFVEAAWTHARSFLAEKNFVPDVMVLGRYVDEELLFVFPSSQDKDSFRAACIAEAASFGADVAMLAGEAEYEVGGDTTPIAKVVFRERGQPIRAQIAAIVWNPQVPQTQRLLGPVSSIPGHHSDPFLDEIFGPQVCH